MTRILLLRVPKRGGWVLLSVGSKRKRTVTVVVGGEGGVEEVEDGGIRWKLRGCAASMTRRPILPFHMPLRIPFSLRRQNAMSRPSMVMGGCSSVAGMTVNFLCASATTASFPSLSRLFSTRARTPYLTRTISGTMSFNALEPGVVGSGSPNDGGSCRCVSLILLFATL